jgi:23S rRNA (cytidine1920-2'-O)/16S rRNA (cytidine1409-2'-O)-methyltransferase
MSKKRIDVLLLQLGLVHSREKAQSLILSGNVLADDTPVTKSGALVSEDAKIRIRGEDHPYVSRGGVKLAAALDQFGVSAEKKIALDVGASTGGFTHVLLLRGAAKIFAIDVGHNQLDWKIRSDPRVVTHEKINARYIEFDLIGQKVDLIVIDVSFISLEKILPSLKQFASAETDWIALVKPQFEVGKDKVGKGGIVTSETDRQTALNHVIDFAKTLGLNPRGLIESPITGTQGNKEFLVHWKLEEGLSQG